MKNIFVVNSSGMGVGKCGFEKNSLKTFVLFIQKFFVKNLNVFVGGSALCSTHYQQKSFSWAVESRKISSAHVFLFNHVKSVKCIEYLEKKHLRLSSLWWSEMQMARRLLSCSGGSSHFCFLRILCKVPIPALGILSSKTTPATELAIFFFTL